jgi:SpoVK/Ycf46/Vps4 family AAA+-type ATPase
MEYYLTTEEKNSMGFVDPVNNSMMQKNEKTPGYNQWAVHTGGRYTPTMPTVQQVPAGFYELGMDNQIGIFFEKRKVDTDELFELPSDELQDIIQDIENFWERSNKYQEYGFLHKRGILLYGEPGAGKSGIIQLCTKHLIEKMNGVVINLSNGDQVDWYSKTMGSFRSVEPNRPLIVILEDIDGIAGEGNWSTSMLLNILDGIKQIDNVVYIATTNYPEQLEERITNRPSRFDRRYEILMPNAKVRESYFRSKLSLKDLESIDVSEWVKKSDGMSMAHLRELVISVVALGNTFEDTIFRLNGMKVKPRVKGRTKKIGFENE